MPLLAAGRRHQPSSLTVPAVAVHRDRLAVLISDVPTFVPTTAGIWYSRATIAVCDRMPPWSVTTAEAMPKSGVQGGIVAGQTRISPVLQPLASSSERITRAVPVTARLRRRCR